MHARTKLYFALSAVLTAASNRHRCAESSGGPVEGSDGNFYGTTDAGGTSGEGTVFMITPGGVETVLYSFTSNSSGDGNEPWAGLVQSSSTALSLVALALPQGCATATLSSGAALETPA